MSHTLTSADVKNHYDEVVPKSIGEEYESSRWFKNPEMQAGYDMTKEAVNRLVTSSHYEQILELGPGSGTWTKLLLANNSKAEVDVVDISEHMLSMAKSSLENFGEQIQYFQSDFLLWQPTKKYQLFFSSRAIEYFTDKPTALKKVSQALVNGGTGFIITKMPKYWAYKLTGRAIPEFHNHQVKPRELAKIIEDQGMQVLEIRPVVITFPFLQSATMHRFLYKLIGRFNLSWANSLFSESYSIKFKKP